MELSYFLAQLFGLMMVVYAVALLYRPSIVQELIEEAGRSKVFGLLASVMGIVPGLAVVLSHNIWVWDWPVLVTVFGWAALLKGIAFLIAPQSLVAAGDTMYASAARTKLVLVIMLAFGLYLAGAGFGMF